MKQVNNGAVRDMEENGVCTCVYCMAERTPEAGEMCDRMHMRM